MDHQFSLTMNCSTKTAFTFFSILLLFATFPFGSAHANDRHKIEFDKLDSHFTSIVSELHRHLASIHYNGIAKVNDISSLESLAKEFNNAGDTDAAASLILLNLSLIHNNAGNQSSLLFISILLDSNEVKAAENLLNIIRKDGDKSLISSASFIFSKYYFKNNQWQDCLKNTADIFTDLPENDANYARLIAGVSRQHLKNHRDAVNLYEKIPVTSTYYPYARINMAVAYIRQGWWTDAQNVISTTLKAKTNTPGQDELINRLYLVMGYSLLKNEYYRDARNAFRNIHKNSQYANRALLGISLASANQEDYVGALNTLSKLKSMQINDISVDESYLLLPYVYSKLGQNMTATASYNEAIQHYQARISEIDRILNNKIPMEAIKPAGDRHVIELGKNIFDYSSDYPISFIDNLNRAHKLNEILSKLTSKESRKIAQKAKEASMKYDEAYKRIIFTTINQYNGYLNSYLDQSRYGIANLFDSAPVGDNSL